MSVTSVNTSLSSAFPDGRQTRHTDYATPICQKIEYLHNLSGLTAFERDFVAQLRSQPIVFAEQLSVLGEIWQRHKGTFEERNQ